MITGSYGPETIFSTGGLRYWHDGRDVEDVAHRRQLLDQWIERLSTFLGLPAKSIGRIGGGRRSAKWSMVERRPATLRRGSARGRLVEKSLRGRDRDAVAVSTVGA
jgi:hypothetical protein